MPTTCSSRSCAFDAQRPPNARRALHKKPPTGRRIARESIARVEAKRAEAGAKRELLFMAREGLSAFANDAPQPFAQTAPPARHNCNRVLRAGKQLFISLAFVTSLGKTAIRLRKNEQRQHNQDGYTRHYAKVSPRWRICPTRIRFVRINLPICARQARRRPGTDSTREEPYRNLDSRRQARGDWRGPGSRRSAQVFHWQALDHHPSRP